MKISFPSIQFVLDEIRSPIPNIPVELFFKIVYSGYSSSWEESARFVKAVALTSKDGYILSQRVQSVWIADKQVALNKMGFEAGSAAINYCVFQNNTPFFSQITYIDLTDLPIVDKELEKLVLSCAHIGSLILKGSCLHEGLIHLQHTPDLRCLSIAWCTNLEKGALRNLAYVTKLQKLNIAATELLEKSLEHLVHTPSLVRLDMRHCKSLSKNALSNLQYVPLLEELDISWCTQLERESWKYLPYLLEIKNVKSDGLSLI